MKKKTRHVSSGTVPMKIPKKILKELPKLQKEELEKEIDKLDNLCWEQRVKIAKMKALLETIKKFFTILEDAIPLTEIKPLLKQIDGISKEEVPGGNKTEITQDLSVTIYKSKDTEEFFTFMMEHFGFNLKPHVPKNIFCIIAIDHNDGWSHFVFVGKDERNIDTEKYIELRMGIPWNNFYEFPQMKMLDIKQEI